MQCLGNTVESWSESGSASLSSSSSELSGSDQPGGGPHGMVLRVLGQLPPGQLPPGQLPPDNCPPDNSHLGQLPTRIIATQSTAPWSTAPLGQFPPRKIAPWTIADSITTHNWQDTNMLHHYFAVCSVSENT